MKMQILKYLIILFLPSLIACDPSYNVDYEIENNSGETVSIVFDDEGINVDTNIISHNTTLIFFNDSGLGFTTEDYLDQLQVLPYEISISTKSGLNYNKDANDISNWTIIYPPKKGEIKRQYAICNMQLTIRKQ